MASRKKKFDVEIIPGVSITVDVPVILAEVTSRLRTLGVPFDKDSNFSRPQITALLGVKEDYLRYYIKRELVAPAEGEGANKHKWFDLSGVLAFFVIVEINASVKLGDDVAKSLQAKIRGTL